MTCCFVALFLAACLSPARGQGSVYNLLKEVTGFSDHDFNVLAETIRTYGTMRMDILRTTNLDVARRIRIFNRRYDSLSHRERSFLDKMFNYAVSERIDGEPQSQTWSRFQIHYRNLSPPLCSSLLAEFPAFSQLGGLSFY
ncbi:hypothetical protein Y032_0015g2625 [Ancylostoma ceylanicum]|uniref:Uncharacterized protein n=1 Tax=Ancylostoma ceylanicum TaxID=53326 RepID=A0A016V8P4_9BILA|nr:hypothetical protein Y032_0015g2625 [Ancylostoma ceylanicum]